MSRVQVRNDFLYVHISYLRSKAEHESWFQSGSILQNDEEIEMLHLFSMNRCI